MTEPQDINGLVALGAEAWAPADAAQPGFGDVLDGTWLQDVHVMADAGLVGGAELPVNLVRKLAGWVGQDDPGMAVPVFSTSFAPDPKTRYALAHASYAPEGPWRAIVVSDTCHVFSCLGMPPKSSPRDRTLLVPVIDVSEEQHAKLVRTGNLARMPLPAHPGLGAFPIAEIRYVFSADANAHKANLCDAVLRLAYPRLLSDYWSAFATRRGAMVAERNAMKLAAVGIGEERPTEAALDRLAPLLEVLDLARIIEDAQLERAADADEALTAECEAAGHARGDEWAAERGGELAADIRQDIVATLTQLRDAADAALSKLV